MSDIEIIKNIDKILGVKFKRLLDFEPDKQFILEDVDFSQYYILNNDNQVIELGLSFCEKEISNSLTIVLNYIKKLKCLTVLYITNNNIVDISDLEFPISLKKLSLVGNKISNIDSLKYLKQLVELDLAENEISDISPLKDLSQLIELSLYRNQVSDITPLKFLTNLETLHLSGNGIKDISTLKYLNKLKKLGIWDNQIHDIAPLKNLKKISTLYLWGNPIKQLPEWITDFDMKIRWGTTGQDGYISFANNLLQSPPIEIIKQGTKAIKAWFKERKIQGEEKLYEAKIVIVGAGESGKTTLIKKLLDPTHLVPNSDDKRTEGIRVTSYGFLGNVRGASQSLLAHIWDFGGQELYHTTHQLFLTPDTLYILLNDNRKNDTDFYYWLNIVTLRAGDRSPIIMVFNAKDSSPRQIIPGEDLYKAFVNLCTKAIEVNFADKDLTQVYLMKTLIEDHFSKLEVLGKPYPAYWVHVRGDLGRLDKEYINWGEFETICTQNKIDDLSQMQILAQTLHNLGVLLYFPDVFGLKDLIILSPQWCIDAIYLALDTKEIDKNAGRFNEAILKNKWSDTRFAGNQLQLLKLMQHFDLCYPVEGTKDFIAPQLLPIEEHKYSGFPSDGSIVFRFDYTFMPAGLLTRLTARMSRHIKTPYVWRTGLTLEWEEGTIAEIIENQFSHKIAIRVNGKERKRRLLEIRKNLQDLHKDFRGLRFEESVACNCMDCINTDDPTIFELKSLEDDAEHNEDVKCMNGKRKRIPARDILNGIEYVDKPRIFISYSHKNEEFKDEFRNMISPMEQEGHWKVWDDRWLLPGDNWNPEIMRHLSEANVIVLMLTPDFFNSKYIYNIEMSRAIQRHEAGDALVIGIIASDCMWEETPLQKIQMIPRDGLAVDRHLHRNEIWKTVANKIKETIAVREETQKRKGGW